MTDRQTDRPTDRPIDCMLPGLMCKYIFAFWKLKKQQRKQINEVSDSFEPVLRKTNMQGILKIIKLYVYTFSPRQIITAEDLNQNFTFTMVRYSFHIFYRSHKRMFMTNETLYLVDIDTN